MLLNLGQGSAITDHECISNSIKVQKYYKKSKRKIIQILKLFSVMRFIWFVMDLIMKTLFLELINIIILFYWPKDAIGHQQIREISNSRMDA